MSSASNTAKKTHFFGVENSSSVVTSATAKLKKKWKILYAKYVLYVKEPFLKKSEKTVTIDT